MTAEHLHDDETMIVNTADPWGVIADTEEEAENLRLRGDLMIAIAEVIRSEGWSQAHAARLVGVTQPRLSDLVRGRIDKFSLDALVNIGMELGLQLVITRTPRSPGNHPAPALQ